MAIPKLKDIAANAGVHPMTVSRALRHVGRMRSETRQRVFDVARQMGYRPDAAAAAMRTGHTGCIAMLSGFDQRATLLPSEVMLAIMEAVAAHGGYLAHATLPRDVDVTDAAKLPRLLGQRMVEGALLNYMPDEPPQFEAFLQRNKLPAVWLNQKRGSNAVYPDDFAAARKVAEQLFALGHKRIAFVRLARSSDTAAQNGHYSVADRVAGYEAAMQQAGLPTEALVFSGQWEQWDEPVAKRLQSLARVFRDTARRPTAVISHGDGALLLMLLHKLEVRVPEDVSLVSFSDCAAQSVEQMVSCMPLPLTEMGRQSVEMLFRMIESGSREYPSVCLPYGGIATMQTVRRVG